MAEPVASLTDGNRQRKASKDDEDTNSNDHRLTRDMKTLEPWLGAPRDQSSGCVNRYYKNLPRYCIVESMWYSKDNLMFVVWDLEDLESVGLPHKSSNHVIFV